MKRFLLLCLLLSSIAFAIDFQVSEDGNTFSKLVYFPNSNIVQGQEDFIFAINEESFQYKIKTLIGPYQNQEDAQADLNAFNSDFSGGILSQLDQSVDPQVSQIDYREDFGTSIQSVQNLYYINFDSKILVKSSFSTNCEPESIDQIQTYITNSDVDEAVQKLIEQQSQYDDEIVKNNIQETIDYLIAFSDWQISKWQSILDTCPNQEEDLIATCEETGGTYSNNQCACKAGYMFLDFIGCENLCKSYAAGRSPVVYDGYLYCKPSSRTESDVQLISSGVAVSPCGYGYDSILDSSDEKGYRCEKQKSLNDIVYTPEYLEETPEERLGCKDGEKVYIQTNVDAKDPNNIKEKKQEVCFDPQKVGVIELKDDHTTRITYKPSDGSWEHQTYTNEKYINLRIEEAQRNSEPIYVSDNAVYDNRAVREVDYGDGAVIKENYLKLLGYERTIKLDDETVEKTEFIPIDEYKQFGDSTFVGTRMTMTVVDPTEGASLLIDGEPVTLDEINAPSLDEGSKQIIVNALNKADQKGLRVKNKELFVKVRDGLVKVLIRPIQRIGKSIGKQIEVHVLKPIKKTLQKIVDVGDPAPGEQRRKVHQRVVEGIDRLNYLQQTRYPKLLEMAREFGVRADQKIAQRRQEAQILNKKWDDFLAEVSGLREVFPGRVTLYGPGHSLDPMRRLIELENAAKQEKLRMEREVQDLNYALDSIRNDQSRNTDLDDYYAIVPKDGSTYNYNWQWNTKNYRQEVSRR